MRAQRLDGGRIRIPVVTSDENVTAHSTEDIGPDDPRYRQWDEWLKREEDNPVNLKGVD